MRVETGEEKDFSLQAKIFLGIMILFCFFGFWVMGTELKEISQPKTVVSHPSLMGQPILNLTFQGSITKVLTSDGIKMDPKPIVVILQRNEAKSVYLTLLGTSGEMVEITGQIKDYFCLTMVEFGPSGEAVLVVNITADHRIKYTQKTDT